MSNILVAGDAGPDFDIYLHSDSDNPSPGTRTAMSLSLGGAGLIQRLLEAWIKNGEPKDTQCCQLPPLQYAAPTFGVLHPCILGKDFAAKGEKDKVWRVRRSIGSGTCQPDFQMPLPQLPLPLPEIYDPRVLVLVDHATLYRHPHGETLPHEKFWASSDTTVIWKMDPPFCRGELWWRGVKANVPARSIVLISLSQLRTEPVRVSCRVSWERTALEIAREVEHNPALTDLRSCRDVVITIHGEGAVWRSWKADNPNEGIYRLIFDPAHMEGEWSRERNIQGEAYGFASMITASIAAQLTKCEDRTKAIEAAIPIGLRAMQLLHVLGHGPCDDKHPNPAFPFSQIALALSEDANAFAGLERKPFVDFAMVEVPNNEIANPDSRWRIAACDSSGVPLHGLARRFAIFGERELRAIPHARFGQLLTADRSEIEELRNFKTLISAYKQGKESKPLSLAVFGPPGAGKSFGVKEIAKQILAGDGTVLEFNLSQFDEAGLAGAFHQVRDAVLRGKMPVVFWDEFDSDQYKWLKLLLAPMNDGVFQEGQITHPLGRCIFVFAGGTSDDAEHFGPKPPTAGSQSTDQTAAWTKFKLAKGPDFMSRLHGTLNILGPNQRMLRAWDSKAEPDQEDVSYPLRRAILLRSALKLKPDQRLDIDPGLLSALLETPRYTNGSRSFEKIVIALRDNAAGRTRYRPSDLPGDAVLGMNVDGVRDGIPGPRLFNDILNREDNFKDRAHVLAKAIHDVWRSGKRKRLGPDKAFNYDCEFDEIASISKKNESIEAAMRMPRNLALAGMMLVPAANAGAHSVSSIPKDLIEHMSEEEHVGWLEVALAEGYRQKNDKEERDDSRYIHDCILPWDKLPDDQKDYDRNIVSKYPIYAEKAGFTIIQKRAPMS